MASMSDMKSDEAIDKKMSASQLKSDISKDRKMLASKKSAKSGRSMGSKR